MTFPTFVQDYALYAVAGAYTLWVFFLICMTLLGAVQRKTISKLSMVLGAPFLVAGLLIDFVVNWTIMPIVMFEAPSEWLVTTRLKRHVNHGTGWRKTMATFICKNMLDTFDPTGCHCCE